MSAAVASTVLARPGMGRLIVVLAFVVVWELTARLAVDPRFLASPIDMFAALPGLFDVRGVPAALATTFWELVASFALSVAIGAPLGLWLGLSSVSRRRILPVVFFLYAIPQVTILPLIIMIFGIGTAAKIAFGASHAVFSIVFTLAAAAQDLDRTLADFARLHGASRFEQLRYVTLPQVAPAFFTGMRMAMVGAILGVLLTELYVSSGGIGYFTRMFSDSFQTARLYALVFLLAAMAIVLNEALRLAELRFSRWRNA